MTGIIIPNGTQKFSESGRKIIYVSNPKTDDRYPLEPHFMYDFITYHAEKQCQHLPLARLPIDRGGTLYDLHFTDLNEKLSKKFKDAPEYTTGELHGLLDDLDEKRAGCHDPMISFPCKFKGDYYMITAKYRWEEVNNRTDGLIANA